MVEVAPSTSLRMMTRQGGEFWKYHYKQNARPARSHVQLVVDEANPMRDCLVWKDVGDRDWMASISLTEIVDVRVGPNSKTFLNNVNHIVNPNLCFSIYTRGRTLDLEAVHPEDLKIWMNGLTYLVDPERRSIDDPTRGEWMSGGRPGTKRVGQGGDLLSQLEKHVEHAYRNGNALEGIADWVALRRQTGIPPAIEAARNNKPDVVNVDEMFLAGPYRTGAPQACHSPPSYPVPDRQTQSPYSPHHHHSPAFKQGLEEGRRVAALSPPGPGRW